MEAHHKDGETCAQVVREAEAAYNDDDDDNGYGRDDEDLLKRTISTHPLYGELVRIHLDCLKAGMAGEVGVDHDQLRSQLQIVDYNKSSQRMVHRSDLDQFMESYCVALSKLREAMEEPQQESMAFIRSMHSQLQEITGIPIAHSNAARGPPLPPPPSSGN